MSFHDFWNRGKYLFALSDDALMFTLTPGNDYFVLVHVFRRLTLGQTQLIHKLMFYYRFIHKTIVFIFVNFVLIEMREKLRSQREAVISLPKP